MTKKRRIAALRVSCGNQVEGLPRRAQTRAKQKQRRAFSDYGDFRHQKLNISYIETERKFFKARYWYITAFEWKYRYESDRLNLGQLSILVFQSIECVATQWCVWELISDTSAIMYCRRFANIHYSLCENKSVLNTSMVKCIWHKRRCDRRKHNMHLLLYM